MIFQADGVLYGDRIGKCSRDAQLFWMRYRVASNTCGRLELNYAKISSTIFASFLPDDRPTEAEFMSHIGEYYKNYLLFTYMADGRLWGQWDSLEGTEPDYQLKADKRTPEPPAEPLRKWREEYLAIKKANAAKAVDFSGLIAIPAENSKTFSKVSNGIGVGLGIGEVRTGKVKPSAKATPSTADPRFAATKDFVERCCNHAGVPFAWDGSESSHLAKWLKANPNVSEAEVIELVRKRFRSKDPPGDRPRVWIGNLGKYAKDGNHGQQNPSKQRQDENVNAFKSALARRGITGHNGGHGELRKPHGTELDGGKGRCLDAGLRGSGAEVGSQSLTLVDGKMATGEKQVPSDDGRTGAIQRGSILRGGHQVSDLPPNE